LIFPRARRPIFSVVIKTEWIENATTAGVSKVCEIEPPGAIFPNERV
jgi:hypothetical protein